MAGFPEVGTNFGGYRIESILGHGGMGIVFRAHQLRLDRPVALKVLSPTLALDGEFRARFEREASVLAALDSPHIIAVFDHGEHDGCLYLATQLVPGGDLAQHLASNGPLAPMDALDLAEQLAGALAVAHDAGVIHRDVKPHNVLLRHDAGGLHSYLCDFGIARRAGDEMTRTGAMLGTYSYLAPERYDGAEATAASDVYALGCMLVAMATGHAPYRGTDLRVMQQHQTAPIPQLDPTTPEARAFNAVVLSAMAKQPPDRPDTAEALRSELRNARSAEAAGESIDSNIGHVTVADPDATRIRPGRSLAPESGEATPVPRTASRRRRLLIVAALVLSSGLAAGYAFTRDEPDQHEQRTSKGCWNGARVPTTTTCPQPKGAAGMAFVFPSLAHERGTKCTPTDAGSDEGKIQSISCALEAPDGSHVRVVYGEWKSWTATLAHYRTKFDQNGELDGDILRFAPANVGLEAGAQQASLVYRERIPFSVTVIAATPSGMTFGMDSIEMRGLNEIPK